MGITEDSSRSNISGDSPLSIAKDELKESEEKYRTLFNLSRDAIMTLSPPDWNFTSGNPATVKMFNAKDEEDFISKAPWEVSPKFQPDGQLSVVKAKKMIEKAMKDGSNFFEWTHKKINGDDFYATVLLSRIEINEKTLLQATVRDITEIKKAEEQINFLAKFPEENPSPVMRISQEGILLYSNKAGMILINALKGKIGSKTPEKILELVNNNNHNRFELDVGDKIFSFEIIEIKDKSYTNLYGRDITSRKKSEKELKKSEENLKEAQELGKIGSWEFELSSGKIIWSDETYALYERDKSLGPPSAEEEARYYSPEEAKKLKNFANLAVKTGKEFKYDLLAKLPSGKTVNFTASMRPIKDNRNNFIKLFGTVQDITERKSAEHALKESEEKFSKLFNLSPNVNVISTFGEGVILDVNKAFEEELGIPREKVIGMKSSDLNFIDSKTRKDAYVRLAKDGLAITDIEAVVKGQKRFGRIFAKEIELNGKKCIFQTIIDLTEQKQAEQDLKGNEQKLRESLATAARQNIQLHRLLQGKTAMQEKIHHYAKQLETRVETLEKEKIPLTSKEKLVFYGLCAYPSLNDLELSEKLKLKRSTITAIRNRLGKDSWFSKINIPNFYALGCESVSVMHCNFNTSLQERRDLGLADEILKMPEIIFSNESDEDSVCIFASKKFVDLQKFLSSSLLMKKDILKGDLKHLSFFFELSIVNQFNFARLLGKLFELNVKNSPLARLSNSKSAADLNHNEKRVLLALIQYPELSIAELSKKIWLSKPTVSKIKSELLENNFFYPLIILDLKKLSLGLAALVAFKFDQKFMKKVHMLEPEIEKLDFHSVCRVVGDKEITLMMLFKNRGEFESEMAKLADFYRKNEIPFTSEEFIMPINKQVHFEKLDMASITKKLLFPEDF